MAAYALKGTVAKMTETKKRVPQSNPAEAIKVSTSVFTFTPTGKIATQEISGNYTNWMYADCYALQYEYDEHKRLKKAVTHHTKRYFEAAQAEKQPPKTLLTVWYDYDASGTLIAQRAFGPEGKPYSEEKYSYDANGNQILAESYLYYPAKDATTVPVPVLFSIGRYTYDNKGLITTYSYYLNDPEDNTVENLVSKTAYRYDKKGSTISETELGAYLNDGVTPPETKYEYTYDKQGNWTLKTTLSGKQKIEITERKIEYK